MLAEQRQEDASELYEQHGWAPQALETMREMGSRDSRDSVSGEAARLGLDLPGCKKPCFTLPKSTGASCGGESRDTWAIASTRRPLRLLCHFLKAADEPLIWKSLTGIKSNLFIFKHKKSGPREHNTDLVRITYLLGLPHNSVIFSHFTLPCAIWYVRNWL